MLMGIAAIAAYALGPGLGGYIFSGISRMGGANATKLHYRRDARHPASRGHLGHRLNFVTRLTVPRGIRV